MPSSVRAAPRPAFSPIALLLLLPALLTCDSDATGPKEVRVGPGGGDVSLAGGAVTLSIPPDALTTEVTFTASPATPSASSELVVPGAVFEIQPTDVQFQRMVRLELSYDPASLPQTVQEPELRLFKAVGGEWESVVNASVDTDDNTVFGTVSGLGTFGASGVPVEDVSLSPRTFTLEAGQTKQFTAVAVDASGTSLPGRPLTWSSSDEAVLTVDGEGLVTAVGVGYATISVSAEGETNTAWIRTWDCDTQTDVPASECDALVAIYGGLNQQEWRHVPSWIPSSDPCDWRGVTCEGGFVSELHLIGANLPGSLPYAIGDLTHLESLSLSRNNLSGLLPASLGELQSLTALDLRSNGFSGSIPPDLGDLSALIDLNLSFNELSGSIPAELGGLENVTTLNLSYNQLSGSIPPELGDLSTLRVLDLRWNELSGSIPSELGKLSNLRELQCLDNHLTGSIPPELGNLTALRELRLPINELSGSIPSELGKLTNLTNLGLARNQLTGSIPAEIGDLTSLEALSLSENQLSGTIPLAVAQLGGRIQAMDGGWDQCVFRPPGNTGLLLPDTQDYRDADLNGDGKICGVEIG